MKDRKKRKQREEVRKILHAMRLELAAQRASQETIGEARAFSVGDLMNRAGSWPA